MNEKLTLEADLAWDNLRKGLGSSLGEIQGWARAAGLAFGAVSIAGVIDQLRRATEAADKEKQALRGLAHDMEGAGVNVAAAWSGVSATLDQLQRSNRQFTRTDQINALSELVDKTNDWSFALEHAQQLSDIAVKFETNLAGAADILANAYYGRTRALQQHLPMLRHYLEEAKAEEGTNQARAVSLRLLAEATEGESARIQDALDVRKKGLASAWNEVQIAISSSLDSSARMADHLGRMADNLDRVADAIPKAVAAFRALNQFNPFTQFGQGSTYDPNAPAGIATWQLPASPMDLYNQYLEEERAKLARSRRPDNVDWNTEFMLGHQGGGKPTGGMLDLGNGKADTEHPFKDLIELLSRVQSINERAGEALENMEVRTGGAVLTGYQRRSRYGQDFVGPTQDMMRTTNLSRQMIDISKTQEDIEKRRAAFMKNLTAELQAQANLGREMAGLFGTVWDAFAEGGKNAVDQFVDYFMQQVKMYAIGSFLNWAFPGAGIATGLFGAIGNAGGGGGKPLASSYQIAGAVNRSQMRREARLGR